MKLVIGLGNPGKNYIHTRHNLGFRVIDELIKTNDFNPRIRRLKYDIYRGIISNEETVLLKPRTYMNNSGGAVRNFLGYTNEPLENILVVCDDFNLPFGKLRVRPGGSTGGHKGLESIIQQLGTEVIPRLRIGIGLPPSAEAVEYVLENFSRQEEKELPVIINEAVEAIKTWISDGIEVSMNKFNN